MSTERGSSNAPRDGSTATVALIINNDVYVANCGDSSAILVHADGSHKVLTEEHGTLNESEIQRVTAAGGSLSPQLMDKPRCCFWSSKVEVCESQ